MIFAGIYCLEIAMLKIRKSPYFKPFSHYYLCTLVNITTHSTWLDRSGLMSVIGNLSRLIWFVPKHLRLFAETYLQILQQKYLNTFRSPYHSLNLVCPRKKFNFFIRFYYYSDSNIKVKFNEKLPSPPHCPFFVQRTGQQLFLALTDNPTPMHSTLVS